VKNLKIYKFNIVLLFIFIAAILASCGNKQASSIEEAMYVVEKLDNCQKVVQYISIRSKALGFPRYPAINESMPGIAELNEKIFVHEIIYQKKDKSFCWVFLNDNRPPEIVAKIDFK